MIGYKVSMAEREWMTLWRAWAGSQGGMIGHLGPAHRPHHEDRIQTGELSLQFVSHWTIQRQHAGSDQTVHCMSVKLRVSKPRPILIEMWATRMKIGFTESGSLGGVA